MLTKLTTFVLVGIQAIPVEVEVDCVPSEETKCIIVGLAETAVQESSFRVSRALANSGYFFPPARTMVNLAPANLPKHDAALDLAIAIGMAAGDSPACIHNIPSYAFIGELSFTGELRPVRGALSVALECARLKRLGLSQITGLILPRQNASEASVVEGIDIIPVESLSQTLAILREDLEPDPIPCDWEFWNNKLCIYDVDFSDVRGQEMAKRALTIAAAGYHNILMIGPPGSGKSMLAKRLPTILPPLTQEESIETTQVYSILDTTSVDHPLFATRPFRAPHHTVSGVALVGGGSKPLPGEISMAHNGVLFLDELPEFSRRTLEVLRQPIEEREITISRASGRATFPANIMLVAAMNPCPCGYRNDPRRNCQCTVPQIEHYINKISGPLLDRIDIHIEVPAVPYNDLVSSQMSETSDQIRERVIKAHLIQLERYKNLKITHNSQLTSRQIREYCRLDQECQDLLGNAINSMGLSARAHDKILRIARTIADLEAVDNINAMHLYEAINYRTLDREFWK